ncbi:MAG: AI-2E family transporter [Bacteroidota bacterium]
MMKAIPIIQIRQFLLILLIAGLTAVLYWNLRVFLPAFLGAYTIYVLFRRPLFYLTERLKWPTWLASICLLLLALITVILPFNGLIQLLQKRVMPAIQNPQSLLDTVQQFAHDTEQRFGIALMTPENIKSLTDWGGSQLGDIVGATLSGVVTLLVMFVMLWFMLVEGKEMEARFFQWLPLKPENEEFIKKQLHDLVFSNALGIPLMGLVQGFAGFWAYWLCGVEEFWLWTVITAVSGMMPVFGVMLAYLPLSLLLYTKGMHGTALFILLYGVIVIGSIDNIARMWVLKKIGDTHPLVTLFGVIVGLKLFGFVGFVFGPIMIALLMMLYKVYDMEFGREAHNSEDDDSKLE